MKGGIRYTMEQNHELPRYVSSMGNDTSGDILNANAILFSSPVLSSSIPSVSNRSRKAYRHSQQSSDYRFVSLLDQIRKMTTELLWKVEGIASLLLPTAGT